MTLSFIKYYGGKYYLGEKYIKLFPHIGTMDYHQPCVGGGQPLLRLPAPIGQEYISDINPEIVNLWKIVKDNPEDLMGILEATECSKESFDRVRDSNPTSPLTRAARMFFLHKVSRSGRAVSFSESTRLRGGIPETINNYLNSIKDIRLVSQRIKRCIIEELDVVDAIERVKNKAFIFLDPPYVIESRISKDVYEYEMTSEKHELMLSACLDSPAKIMICGYDSYLYADMLKNWTRASFKIASHAGENTGSKSIKNEIIWMNY